MATDNEKAEFFTTVMQQMEAYAKRHNVPLEAVVVRYSKALQPNGLPEYYRIEMGDEQ